MVPGRRGRQRVGTTLATAVLVVGAAGNGRGQEPGLFGRLLRFGSKPAAAARPAPPAPVVNPVLSRPAPAPAPPPAVEATGNGPRLVPQPRVSRPATEADPLVTRFAVLRADDGRQVGLFLHVFADGTVLDAEGVHHVGPEALRPLVQALQAGDFHRPRGHCGGPPTDAAELVHLVVYDRPLGRLRASSFSASGNAEGCDPALRGLLTALDALQARLSGPPPAAAPPVPSSAPPVATDPRPITLTTP